MNISLGSRLFPQTICLGILLFLFNSVIIAQEQPLSRNDKAQIQSLSEQYKTAESTSKWMMASKYLNDIAFIYWEHNDYKNAIAYYEKSLVHNQTLANENGIAMIQNNLGMLYSDIGEYERSLGFFEQTLAARRAFNNDEGMVAAIKNISVVLNNLGRYDQSIQLLQEALSIARKSYVIEELMSCYLMLSETYEKIGDIPNTKQYYDLYQTFYNMKQEKDIEKFKEIADEEALLKEIAELQSSKKEEELHKLNLQLQKASDELEQFDEEKIALSNTLSKTQLQVQFLETEQENERLLNEEAQRRAAAIRNMLLLGGASLMIVSLIVYRNYKKERKSKEQLHAQNIKINEQNVELEELNAIIAKHNDRMQSELNVGKEIQMSMLPTEFPNRGNIELFARLEPALEVGGDLYDYYFIDDDTLIFGLGDVSDKGVPAALFMSATKTLIKSLSKYHKTPNKILTEVNNQLSQDNEASMFVTYYLCSLQLSTGKLTFCNAGHNPPLYKGNNHHQSLLSQLHGPPLGAAEGINYKGGEIIMSSQEQILLFTDGITEALDGNNELYSTDNLNDKNLQFDSDNPEITLDNLFDDVKNFRGDADQSDDMTALSLIYKAIA